MKEVERRGLEGGINLVRGLREELRDLEFHLSEIRSRKTECRTKISMIYARIPELRSSLDATDRATIPHNTQNDTIHQEPEIRPTPSQKSPVDEEDKEESMEQGTPQNGYNAEAKNEGDSDQLHMGTLPSQIGNGAEGTGMRGGEKAPSEKVATGDSQALAVIQPGNRGFFTVDLWQVLLRIIGFDRAAYRRGVQVSASRPNVMIV
jgi:hypothetical protein